MGDGVLLWITALGKRNGKPQGGDVKLYGWFDARIIYIYLSLFGENDRP